MAVRPVVKPLRWETEVSTAASGWLAVFSLLPVDISLITYAGSHAANQRASTFRMVTMQRDTPVTDCDRGMSFDDFVHPVLWTTDQIVEAGNPPSVNQMGFRSSDYLPPVGGRVADDNHLQSHINSSPM
jgi:hypothetical protein